MQQRAIATHGAAAYAGTRVGWGWSMGGTGSAAYAGSARVASTTACDDTTREGIRGHTSGKFHDIGIGSGKPMF